MMGHNGICEVCGRPSDEDDVLDGPEPADKLCPPCRKTVRDLREHRATLAKQQKVG